MAIFALFRKFAAKTQHDYVQRVKYFAAFLGARELHTLSDPRRSVTDIMTEPQSGAKLTFLYRRNSNIYGLRDQTKQVIRRRCQEAESRVNFVGDFTRDDRAIFA
jgi:hypothetical protein